MARKQTEIVIRDLIIDKWKNKRKMTEVNKDNPCGKWWGNILKSKLKSYQNLAPMCELFKSFKWKTEIKLDWYVKWKKMYIVKSLSKNNKKLSKSKQKKPCGKKLSKSKQKENMGTQITKVEN